MRIAEKVFCEIAETLSEDKLKSLSENTFISEEKSIAEHFEKRVEERFEEVFYKEIKERCGKGAYLPEKYFFERNLYGKFELSINNLRDAIIRADDNYIGIDRRIYIKYGVFTFVLTKEPNKDSFTFLTLLEPSKNNITFETKKAINYTQYKKILRARKAAAKAKAEAASE